MSYENTEALLERLPRGIEIHIRNTEAGWEGSIEYGVEEKSLLGAVGRKTVVRHEAKREITPYRLVNSLVWDLANLLWPEIAKERKSS